MKNLLSLALFLFAFLNLASAYTVHIPAPAVLENTDMGVLTNIYLNVSGGNGTVSVATAGGGSVGQDTVASAQAAAHYASSYLAVNASKYDFKFTIYSNSSNVSGPSAGLALTLLSIAGIEQRQLNPNFTVTGTINSTGGVGQIGGIFDKVQAANSIHAKYILVPYLPTSNYQYFLYYISQQAYDVPVIQVENASQAVQYALGTPTITMLNYTIYNNYEPTGLAQANSSCNACNDSAFRELTNFTFNFTKYEINAINGTRFGAIKSQLQNQLDQYQEIGSKGYLYSAADLAFNEYPTAFLLMDYKNSDYYDAASVLNGISSYCSSIGPPPELTNTNYEYVFGGETRLEWAAITLSEAYQELNSSQTSDEVLEILQSAAPAYSWCMASGEMYNIASTMGGTNVTLSPAVQQKALGMIQALPHAAEVSLYANASRQAYASGEYGAALYSVEYAYVFFNTSNLAFSTSSSVNSTVSDALQSANSVWAQQFAYQAEFYMYEASISNSTTAPKYLSNAYTTAILSQGLGSVNSYLQSNFELNNTQTMIASISQQLAQTQYELQLILTALVAMIILIIVVIVVLMFHILEHRKPAQRKR